ncbi:MAG: DUF937 domain-containing protein [Methylocystis sp.]
MADINRLLSTAQEGQLATNLAQRFNLSEEEINKSIQALGLALAYGMDRAVEQPQNFEKVVQCLCASSNCCAHDHSEAAYGADSLVRGQTAILSLFGSEAQTNEILQAASRQSGVSTQILRQLLPIIASVLFSGLSKSRNNQGLGGLLAKLINSGALGGLLEQLAGGQLSRRSDINKDLDDLLGQVLGEGAGSQGSPPISSPQTKKSQGDSPLGGLFGGLLNSIFGKKRSTPGDFNRDIERGRASSTDPLDMDGGKPTSEIGRGFDQAQLEQALEKVKQSLQIDGDSLQNRKSATDLDKLLGQLFGR